MLAYSFAFCCLVAAKLLGALLLDRFLQAASACELVWPCHCLYPCCWQRGWAQLQHCRIRIIFETSWFLWTVCIWRHYFGCVVQWNQHWLTERHPVVRRFLWFWDYHAAAHHHCVVCCWGSHCPAHSCCDDCCPNSAALEAFCLCGFCIRLNIFSSWRSCANL